jgi:hypothetical protein
VVRPSQQLGPAGNCSKLLSFVSMYNAVTNIKGKRPTAVWRDVGAIEIYELDDRGSRVRFPAGAGAGIFSLHHRVQTGSGAHPASYPMGTRGSFLGGKAAEG